jgi:hypothetical protein
MKARGQALVELAMALPVLLLLALGVVAVGRLVYAHVALTAVVREATRAVATSATPQDTSQGVTRGREVAQGYGLDLGRLSLTVYGDGGFPARGSVVRARASYQLSLRQLAFAPYLPLPGTVTVTREASQVVEQFRSR